MTRRWLTIASPTTEAMVNPLLAACELGYIPDSVGVVANPTVEDQVDAIQPFFEDAVGAYDGDATVEVHTVPTETDFDAIATVYQDALTGAGEDETVAVDITPGRKFMSAIAFQAGIQFGAGHVFYLLLDSADYYEQVYADIPRPAVELIDFTEVV